MKRFADQDKEKALAQQEMAIGDDPRGGIDKIATASLKHNKDEDTKFIKTTVETFLTGGKAPNGLPNGVKILERPQAQLAAEEIIHTWVPAPGVSDAALDDFMNKNMGNVWKQYDMDNRGYLDSTEWTYFMRNLLEAQGPPDAVEKNPYAEKNEDEDSEKTKSKKETKGKKKALKETDAETKNEEENKDDDAQDKLDKKNSKKDKKDSDEESPKKEKKEDIAVAEEDESADKKKKETKEKTEEGAADKKKKKATEEAEP